MYHAVLSAPGTAIAPDSNWSYTGALQMVEGLVQAAWLAIAGEDSALDAVHALRRWRLNAAGFIRFGAERGGQGPWRLQLRRSWADGKLRLFRRSGRGRPRSRALTLHHLEFDRQETAIPARDADEQQ